MSERQYSKIRLIGSGGPTSISCTASWHTVQAVREYKRVHNLGGGKTIPQGEIVDSMGVFESFFSAQ